MSNKNKEITFFSLFVVAILFSVMFFYNDTKQMQKELQKTEAADTPKISITTLDSSFYQIKK